ncbi:hypothetical protein EW026_g76 [Hermanssonia centrifuga]|uniref:SAP domain-containing protein n=1 Tax=Hermanssonia centrifuga TaxID=98765 RepID=A0A4S4KVM8_9APHY|nr:hypothetical protein EW026_g76 [Hermanssonia centrifuga]
MAAIPDRKTLESLRRADLQKLCKDHGLKANMKSDALIDLLIDTAKAASNPRGIKRNPSLRTEEEETEEGDSLPQNGVASTSNAPTEPSPPSGPASRTRKAKVTQFRLGVGRPTAAGGSGARAVTKSLSVSRGGRIRGSKSMKPQETAIQEEEEEHEPSKPFDPLVEQPEAGPSGTIHSTPPSEVIPHNEVVTASSSLVDSSDIQQRITDIHQPDDDEDLHLKASVAKAPSFTIFSGPEEPPEPFSDGPPTTRLSDIFTFPTLTPPNGSSIPTVTANAGENQIPPTGEHAFSFSFANSIFQPLTSTPAPHAGAPSQNFAMSIPPPEPPTSPTPAGPSGGYVERAGGRRERNDLFNPLGLPSGSRPSRPQSAASRPASRAAQSQAHLGVSGPPSSTGESTINPTALLRRTPPLSSVLEEEQPPLGGAQPSTPSHDILRSAPLGFMGMAGVVPTLFPPDTPAAAPVRRTMYGTELEGDTRFGDFGVEGVATGVLDGGGGPPVLTDEVREESPPLS